MADLQKRERIQKIISNYGTYSRREAERLIEKGKVKVNGKIVTLGDRASLDDTIFVNDKQLKFSTKHLYYVLNKPKGYISSRIDEQNRRVIDLVDNPNKRNLFTIGRLDVNTTGLIIITSDGELSQRVNTPQTKVSKQYLVWLDKPISPKDILALKKGIELESGKTTLPVKKLKIISNKNGNYLVKLTIIEGKQNQIKRMFSALNNEVINLKRVKIGNINLDSGLQIGKYRKYSQQEIYNALGLKPPSN